MNKQLCVAIVGPTASGKTGLGIEYAQKVNGEILCMDSTTVYRGFDIGTSKPTAEQQQTVPHHMLDILNPDEPFSAGHFVDLAENHINEIHQRHHLPIVTGGTYFYLKALQHGMFPTPIIPGEVIDGIEAAFAEEDGINTVAMHKALAQQDPKAAEKIHPNDRYRLVRSLAILQTTGELPSALSPETPPVNENRIWVKYAVVVPRETLTENIRTRAEQMVELGLVDETRKLREKYPNARALGSIGYSECCQLLDGNITERQLVTEIVEKTRQLAKRQMTWLRSDAEVRFVDLGDLPRMELETANLLEVLRSQS